MKHLSPSVFFIFIAVVGLSSFTLATTSASQVNSDVNESNSSEQQFRTASVKVEDNWLHFGELYAMEDLYKIANNDCADEELVVIEDTEIIYSKSLFCETATYKYKCGPNPSVTKELL